MCSFLYYINNKKATQFCPCITYKIAISVHLYRYKFINTNLSILFHRYNSIFQWFKLTLCTCTLHFGFQAGICKFAFLSLHFPICSLHFPNKKEVDFSTSILLLHHFFCYFVGEQSHSQLSHQAVFISADSSVIYSKVNSNVLQSSTFKVTHFKDIIIRVSL